jgi:hypothetical protein
MFQGLILLYFYKIENFRRGMSPRNRHPKYEEYLENVSSNSLVTKNLK